MTLSVGRQFVYKSMIFEKSSDYIDKIRAMDVNELKSFEKARFNGNIDWFEKDTNPIEREMILQECTLPNYRY